MSQPQYIESEYCPSCGSFVDSLNEETGWCNPCSGVTPCQRCNKSLTEHETVICNKCKYLGWLEANANALDRTMVEKRVNAATAKRLVLSENRPVCLSCLNPIRGGTKGRHMFCKKTAKCRKAHNAYRYYKNYRRFTHEEALQRALESATIYSLIEGIHGKAIHGS